MKIETEQDLATAKNMSFACDQLTELEIGGCEIWRISGDNWIGSMCRLPNGRGAVMTGGDSSWGDWEGDTLLLDNTDPDARIRVTLDGEEFIRE